MKRFSAIVLACLLCIMSGTVVRAEEFTENENQDINFKIEPVTEIVPYAKYLMNVQTTIIKENSSTVGIRADVYCSQVMSQINITFYLQKLSGSTWVTVATKNASASNVSWTNKRITASGLSAGTYRAKATARVVDKYGYAESGTSFTGGIKVG